MEKQTNIYELAQDAYKALSAGGEWLGYLRSAAWNFRFGFSAQTMIWAQRPEATACYSFDEWHDRFNRKIRRGAKGIALLDDRKDQLALSYVFDYSDTYSPEGKHITPWQLTEEKEPAVRRALIREFMPDQPGISEDTDALGFYTSAVYALVEDRLSDTLPDLLAARPGCRLSEVSEAKTEEFYRFLLWYSATAIVMYRCGVEPGIPDYLFENVQYFDSSDAMSILGDSVQHLSKQILREIALTVSAWDKEHAHEKEEEKSHENEPDVSAGRGVSDPAPDRSEQSGASEQVQPDAEEVSAGKPQQPVHQPSDVRDADGPSDPGRENDPGTGRQDPAVPFEEEPGASDRQSGLGTAHGEPAQPGGGTGSAGDRLPVNYFTNRQIEEVLLRAPTIEAGKYRIQRAVEENSEDLHLALIDEFGPGGRFLFHDGTEGLIRCDSSGIHLRADNYNPTNITWTAAETRIRALVEADRYLDEQEKIQSRRYFEAQEQLHKRQETGETLRVFASVYGPKDHDFIRLLQEDLRAYIYEHSETARVALLKTIGSLSELPVVKEDAEAVALITQTLNALGADVRPEDSPMPPSAADAGIYDPFPTDEELTERKAQQEQPLDREPLDDIPDFTQIAATEPSEPAGPILAEGEVVTLAGTDYVILRADDKDVTIQDMAHPLFTQQLPLSTIQTLLANQAQTAVKENPITSEPETPSESGSYAAVKGEDITHPTAEVVRNPEPEIDHPELITQRHFPLAREDKEMLSDLLIFATDYRSTFARNHPDLSEHDRQAYDAATELVRNIVVTDSIYENVDHANALCNYIKAWYLPFSDGLDDAFIQAAYDMVDRAEQLNADEIFDREQKKEGAGQAELSAEPVVNEPEPASEPAYDESSFHEGDYYEDAFTRGVITRIYLPEEGVPHEAAFGILDPDAPEGSRDAKGYVLAMAGALERLNHGLATLTPGDRRETSLEAKAEPSEPSLFDFRNDEPAPQPRSEEPEQAEETARPIPVQASQNTEEQERINFRLPSETVPLGGPKARYESNIAAIRLLKQLEAEDRLATASEQEILSKYVGWGGISEAFDPNKSSWSKEYEELKDLLTEEEYEAARESTLTAFYTPPEVMDAVYQVLGNLGFKRGNILDPGCGTGSFSGRLPEEMGESRVYGVEKDSISGRIARQLYQKNNITIEGYEDTKLPDNFFDVAVGNVPFGDFKVADRRYDKLKLPIHDYFFAKTLDKVRPGGVIAFITSMGTMDKRSTEFRRYLSQRADLLGAIRLPNNTFKTNAGTDVTSDIIFLQKREAPRVEEAVWVDTDRRYNYETGEFGPEMNAYFAYSPEMILGEMKEISGPHGPELACIAKEGQDLKAELARAAENIVGAISEPEQGLYDQEYEQRQSIPADPDVRNYSYTLVDDAIYFREDSEMFKVETSKKGEERIRGLVGLRDIVHELIDAQVEGESDEVIHDLQQKLNTAYNAFTARNGLINSRGNDLAFSDDSSYYLLCSLERVNDKGEFLGKADMFTKRTIHAHERVDHVDTAQEALAVSLGERGRIDFEYMTELSGLNQEQLAKQLQGQIFRDPEDPDKYEIAALYLSGNVREKLHMARQAEADEPGVWTANIKALEGVQPQDLEPADITVRLGSTWIPKEDYTQFMYELLNTPHWYQERGSMEVLYSPYTNTWSIKNINWDDHNSKATTTYGTRRMNGYRILENTLNLKDVKVYDTIYEDGKDKRVLNEAETLDAQEKQQQIKDAFREWIWSDPDRADRLCRAYNERFNSYVPPKFDGSMVQFHNMRPGVSMRPWQRDAVARIIYNGNTLLAHAVGAGKTWTMSAAAMEMKHLGLCSKSLIVVPNHLVGQWASAIYDQYPNAKVLASTKKDFETRNRKKFCSRIATGDYDVVVIGHSQFERIPLSQERQEAGIRAEIDKVVDAIAELKAEKEEHFTIKQMERAKKSLETRLERLHNGKKRDDVITFEQLGIDRLFVDESHEYKNLFLYTKMQNVAGISQTDSQKASDMFLKCRYMDELTGNKGTIHATGTPLSNTMAELYATQRYLQHDLLERMGLGSFDQWASTFGETVTSVELAPEGTGYRARTRFANFFNIPELMSLYCQVADIQTADMLDLPLPTPHYENVVVPASDVQKDYVKGLGERAQKIRTGGVRPEEDNMLKITSDGRKLALDQRLIDPSWPDNSDSKVNACAENIFKIWKAHEMDKATQLVFCDISTPNAKEFNVYDDLREKLVALGIPAEEIRFIHEANTDAQKEALFQQVRDGKVRVLMGSTGKMGTGTNVQDLLVAGHDLDCPWRPSDLEQRAGRVIRQGNGNDDVYMYRYVTEGTFDAYMYQLVENKQRFISQIFTSKPAVRQAADVDEIVMSFAEIKALASGNPLIKERVETEGEVQRLRLLKSRHDNAQYRLNRMVTRDLPERISGERSKLAGYEKDVAFIKSSPSRTAEDHLLPVEVKGTSYEKPKDAGEAIFKAIKRAAKDQVTPIGVIRGFAIEADLTERGWDGELRPKLVLRGPGRKYSVGISDSEVGMIHRLNNVLDKEVPDYLDGCRKTLASLEHDLESAKLELGKPFPRESELAAKQARLEELTRQLDLDAKEDCSGREVDAHDTDANEPSATKPSLDSVIQSAQARQTAQSHSGETVRRDELEV